MLGDVLKRRLHELSKASNKKVGKDAFWVILRDIAREEIIALSPQRISSDQIVPVYYEILQENEDMIPPYFLEKLNNNQERYRVTNRNLFTSNAFNPDGLANQDGIDAIKDINPYKKGYKIIYKGVGKDDN